jgi:hypothetical protein
MLEGFFLLRQSRRDRAHFRILVQRRVPFRSRSGDQVFEGFVILFDRLSEFLDPGRT